jgi:hypothetical protein
VPGPYFHKQGWPPFVHQGTEYSLAHLSEYEFTVEDTDKQPRVIAVTFADHCFTRKQEPGDSPALIYPKSDRKPGVFCFTRYALSKGLVGHIANAATGNVWSVVSENFAAVSVVDKAGRPVLYGIVFSLDPVTGLPVDLHMRVQTAYAVDEKELTTFGQVRFRHLVALRIKGKRPGRITDHNRKRPRNPVLDEHKKK